MYEGKNQKRKKITQIGTALGAVLALILAIILIIGNADGLQDDVNQPNLGQNQTESGSESETGTQESEKEQQTMQIVMVGDMLMHDKIIVSGKKEDGSYNYDHLFENVKDFISAADLAIVNQEVMTGGSAYGYTGYPSFNSPYALVDAEAAAGFDVALLATNHTLDKGKKAVYNCMDYIDAMSGFDYVGINRTQEAQDNDIYIYEQNGIKVAILNYTYGTNGIPLPSDAPYLVNLMDEQKIRADIRKAEEIADFTIVCPHWGTELKMNIDSYQKKWSKIFLEEGVDLILGAHPHVIEPIEWLRDDNGNEMLVYYSLGNFVNGTTSTGHGVTTRMIGGIADVTIGRNPETGKVEVIRHDAVEIVCHQGVGTDFTVYFLDEYTEEMANQNLIKLQDTEFSKSLCESIFAQVWGEEE